ncbi:signal transduction histidine kinase [Lachnospiraceae bacterium PF1-22]|uniref:HAMP domain-containing sensor histidine kinase n=1 Tax=Ohessyouella blattaphilus TaxID=2949333 RepID=UPI003E2D8461
MDKIRQTAKNLPILHTFVLFVVVFALLAVVLTEIERTMLVNAQQEIAFQYYETVEGYSHEKVWNAGSSTLLSPEDSSLMRGYENALWLLPPITYLLCILAAGLLFYRSKLKQPITLLNKAAERIASNDLDFKIEYDRQDEMGKLCGSFEVMRATLEQNNREMWRQMDDRKRLNAAFTHDLRTPLTVLEGYVGILQEYLPQGRISIKEAAETFATIQQQIGRLNKYADSMGALQRLEDVLIQKTRIDTGSFLETLQETASIICAANELEFINECASNIFNIDGEIVLQVYENLLSNAIRFADNTVTIRCNCTSDELSITVSDDGSGFDEPGLHKAAHPFYGTDKGPGSNHYGLGLYICKTLCERHGGYLRFGNNKTGGAFVQASFDMNE